MPVLAPQFHLTSLSAVEGQYCSDTHNAGAGHQVELDELQDAVKPNYQLCLKSLTEKVHAISNGICIKLCVVETS